MSTLRRMPDHAVTFQIIDGRIAQVGAHECNGNRFYTRVDLADIPYDLTTIEDLHTAILERADDLADEQSKAGW